MSLQYQRNENIKHEFMTNFHLLWNIMCFSELLIIQFKWKKELFS